MRHRFPLWCALGVLVLAPGASFAKQSRYPYIVAATSRMLEVNALGSRAQPAELAAAAKQACNALTLLTKDPVFLNELKTWSQNAQSVDRSALKRDLELFAKAFLGPERSLLEQAGFSKAETDQILATATTVQSTIDAKVTDAMVLTSIARLRTEICNASVKTETLAQRADRDQLMRRWVVGLMGVGLVIADVVVTGPVAVVSGVAGALLLDRATPEIAK